MKKANAALPAVEMRVTKIAAMRTPIIAAIKKSLLRKPKR